MQYPTPSMDTGYAQIAPLYSDTRQERCSLSFSVENYHILIQDCENTFRYVCRLRDIANLINFLHSAKLFFFGVLRCACRTRRKRRKIRYIPRVEYVNPGLAKWAEQAGLKKHVTFHTARHTFATMMLTLGADLYTVSKLLGHSDVKVTQVYAKIVNQKKNDAVNLVNSVFA